MLKKRDAPDKESKKTKVKPDAKKKADETVEDIMEEKGIDRKSAWRIKQQRDEDKYREDEWAKQQKKDGSTEATSEVMDNIKALGNEAIEKFKDPDLLLYIKKELDKDHLGDNKEKMFLFCSSCSSRLIPSYRFSNALTGYTSEGKTNAWKTVCKHLPDHWYIDVTRATRATLEDNLQHVNLISFGEESANRDIIETIKQLVEDGISSLKKDLQKDMKDAKYDKQPRKVGIYSTTKDSSDEELATRYCVSTIMGSPAKYEKVNIDSLETAGNIDKEINRVERNKTETWLKIGLKQLKKFDFIHIPYAPLISVNSNDARSMRDLKRFLNLMRSIAWICQFNRVQYKYRGYDILVVSVEDFYNAMEIGKEIFDQSLSGKEERLQRVIDSYKKIVKEQPESIYHFTKKNTEGDAILDTSKFENLSWVDRHLIQKDLKIGSRDTIKSHVKRLEEMGIFATAWAGNRSFLAFRSESPTNPPTSNPLITNEKKEFYRVINEHENEILNELLVGQSLVNKWVNSPEERIRNNLLSLDTHLPTNTTKKVDDYIELKTISALKEKISGLKLAGEKNQEKKQKESLDHDKETETTKLNDKVGSQENDSSIPEYFDDATLLCEVRDIMKTKPRFQWAINDIAFKVGLAGSQACSRIKKLLDNELMANPEKTWVMKHDENGLHWSYREVNL